MKYALVTGASSGMGLSLSRQLAAKGYGIILVSNRSEENRVAAEQIQSEMGVKTFEMNVDLTSTTAAQDIYEQVKAWNLEVEVLVSNAGMLVFSTLNHTPIQRIDQIMALHCTTPIKLIRLFAQDMIERQKGYILITSSSSAWMKYPTISLYGGTKALLKNFSRAIWYEYRRYGIGVTTLYPGAVDTPFYQLDDRKRKFFRRIGLMMSPDKVASSALRALFNHRHRCIPGWFTKVTVFLCSIHPAWIFLLILKIPAIQRILDKA